MEPGGKPTHAITGQVGMGLQEVFKVSRVGSGRVNWRAKTFHAIVMKNE